MVYAINEIRINAALGIVQIALVILMPTTTDRAIFSTCRLPRELGHAVHPDADHSLPLPIHVRHSLAAEMHGDYDTT